MDTTQKFTYFFKEGFIKGESRYIIATEEKLCKENLLRELKNVKWAIYEGDTGERLTDFFDWISPLGLVKGQSPYFRATQSKKEALFSLNGQITPWFDKIRDRGALTGESPYFWGKKNGYYALYHIETGEKLTDEFKSSVIAGAVIGQTNYIIGSYGDEIFFILDLKSGETVTPEFDEDTLIKILKDGDIEKAVKQLNNGSL